MSTTVLGDMPPPPPALFIADARGLDFLNSIATPADTPIEWLGSGEDFVTWLRQAGLVAPQVLEAIVPRAMPGELDRVADQARALREWFRQFVQRHMGQPLSGEALTELAPLNSLLARDEAHGQVVFQRDREGLSHFGFETVHRWRSPESLLIPLGEAMARVVVEEDFSHVKACEGHHCTLIFADHTRGHARRWCSMSVCGNRAKVNAHRVRRKAG
jgi:predicted RNA-binding Zn ribbon-like protein